MESHEKVMRDLLQKNRDWRALKRKIYQLTENELLDNLENNGCNLEGDIESLRCRLLRSILRKDETNLDCIPWYPFDTCSGSTARAKRSTTRAKRSVATGHNAAPDVEKVGVQPRGARGSCQRRPTTKKQPEQCHVSPSDSGSIDNFSSQQEAVVEVHAPFDNNLVRSRNNVDKMPPISIVSAASERVFLPGQTNIRMGATRVDIAPELSQYFEQFNQGLNCTIERVMGNSEGANLVPKEKHITETPKIRRDKVTFLVEKGKIISGGNLQNKQKRINKANDKSSEGSVSPGREQFFTPKQNFDEINRENSTESVSGSSAGEDDLSGYYSEDIEFEGQTTGNKNELKRQVRFSGVSNILRFKNNDFEKENYDNHRMSRRENFENSSKLEIPDKNNSNFENRNKVQSRVSVENVINKGREFESSERLSRKSVKGENFLNRETGNNLNGNFEIFEDSDCDEENFVGRSKRLNSRNFEKKEKGYRGRDFVPCQPRESSSRDYLGRDIDFNSERNQPYHETMQAVKFLKTWGIKFSGEDKNDDPEELIEQLNDCKRSCSLSDRGLIDALPSIFSRRASRWFRTIRDEVRSWPDFVCRFRNNFVGEYDEEDLLDDLRLRSQGKVERITNYLSSVRYLVSKFSRPPSEKYIVKIVFRNLLPTYRKAMLEKLIITLDDIEEYGRAWERQLALDVRYTPPPPVEKMRVRGAAYFGSTEKSKLAALKDDGVELSAKIQSEKPKNHKIDKKKFEKRDKSEVRENNFEDVEVSAVNQMQFRQMNSNSNFNKNSASQFQLGGQFNPNFNVNKNKSFEINQAGNFNQSQTRFGNNNGVRLKEQFNSSSTVQPGKTEGGGEKIFYGACYHCQSVGHRASECPEVVCNVCETKGHKTPDCPEVICNFCHNKGHVVKNCPKLRSEIICFVCQVPGHISKNCPNKKEQSRQYSNSYNQSSNNKPSCVLCGKMGVFANSCSNCAQVFNKTLGNGRRGVQN